MRKIYKIVESRPDGLLVSFNNGGHLGEDYDGGGLVIYAPGLISVPHLRCGDLCAFSSLKAARAFVNKVGRPQRSRPWQIWSARGTTGTLGRAFNRVGYKLLIAPPGTAFMASLTLEELVDVYSREQ